jgi:hypothetical protein
LKKNFNSTRIHVTLSKLIVGIHNPNKTIMFSKCIWLEFEKKSEKMKNGTLVEERLDGIRNFSSWKSRLQVTLEEYDLLDVVTKTLPNIATDEEKNIRKEEDSKETPDKHSKMRSLHQPLGTIREEMFQKFNASDVKNMGTMQEIFQPGRKEDNMLPPLTLIETHPKRMKIRERRSTSSKEQT